MLAFIQLVGLGHGMSYEDRRKALYWYVNDCYPLSTIAQHFDISVCELKVILSKGGSY